MTSRNEPDLYAILGVDLHASSEQISHAYRAQLRRHHPDTRSNTDHGGDGASDTSLQHVLAAYAVLRDPARRADYDRQRKSAPTQRRHPRTVASHPPVLIGTITCSETSPRPAWIAPIDTTSPPSTHPPWEWIRTDFDP